MAGEGRCRLALPIRRACPRAADYVLLIAGLLLLKLTGALPA